MRTKYVVKDTVTRKYGKKHRSASGPTLCTSDDIYDAHLFGHINHARHAIKPYDQSSVVVEVSVQIVEVKEIDG